MADRGSRGAVRAVIEKDGLDGRVVPEQPNEFRSAITRVSNNPD